MVCTHADAEGRYSAALFVQWVPYELAGTSWEEEEAGYVQHLLGLVDRFAPGMCHGGSLDYVLTYLYPYLCVPSQMMHV